MNEHIIGALHGAITINNQAVPVHYLTYDGTAESYITFEEVDRDAIYRDDKRDIMLRKYDVDLFTPYDTREAVAQIIKAMEDAGARWMPADSGAEQFERDTKLYHSSICFELLQEAENNG